MPDIYPGAFSEPTPALWAWRIKNYPTEYEQLCTRVQDDGFSDPEAHAEWDYAKYQTELTRINSDVRVWNAANGNSNDYPQFESYGRFYDVDENGESYLSEAYAHRLEDLHDPGEAPFPVLSSDPPPYAVNDSEMAQWMAQASIYLTGVWSAYGIGSAVRLWWIIKLTKAYRVGGGGPGGLARGHPETEAEKRDYTGSGHGGWNAWEKVGV